jgi:hypothetical protein
MVLWWAGLLLESLILGRSVRTRTFRKYPMFFFYIACVFLISAGLYIANAENPATYARWYWPTQLLTLVLGYGVIIDILQQALAHYPGAERFARTIGLGIFFVVFCWVAVHFAAGEGTSIGGATTELERSLRVVEALFLATILTALAYYRIGIGRNLKGLILGMGAYVAVSLITLALVAFIGPRFNFAWQTLQSGSYLVALGIWTVALWSYAPNPAPAGGANGVEGDYAALAGHTRARLESLRSYFSGTARQ